MIELDEQQAEQVSGGELAYEDDADYYWVIVAGIPIRKQRNPG